MEPASVIALVAVSLSALTFIATQFGSRRTATASYVSTLEKRVETLEDNLERCQERNAVNPRFGGRAGRGAVCPFGG